MKLFLLAAFVAVAAADLRSDFLGYQKQFGKVYSTHEESEKRFAIFSDNIKKIEEHNKAGHSWTKGVNQFTDMTDEEFRAQYTGGYKRMPSSGKSTTVGKKLKDLPASVDWRTENVITDVKNQGACGSCWAFATTEMVESYHALETNTKPPMVLSAQQVTSCTPNTLSCGGTGGCMGSIPQLGYTYLQLFGHVLESDWPYHSGSDGDTGNCDYDLNSMTPPVSVRGYEILPANDQDAVMTHVATVGPLAVAVDASHWGSYNGGVFSGCDYNSNIDLNHAVQLVGYGSENGQDYWLVRNSWGGSWGESGYIKLLREATAQCGTDSTPMDGTACEGGPGSDSQHVCGQCGVLFDVSHPIGAYSM